MLKRLQSTYCGKTVMILMAIFLFVSHMDCLAEPVFADTGAPYSDHHHHHNGLPQDNGCSDSVQEACCQPVISSRTADLARDLQIVSDLFLTAGFMLYYGPVLSEISARDLIRGSLVEDSCIPDSACGGLSVAPNAPPFSLA